jgi:hypothetical protein
MDAESLEPQAEQAPSVEMSLSNIPDLQAPEASLLFPLYQQLYLQWEMVGRQLYIASLQQQLAGPAPAPSDSASFSQQSCTAQSTPRRVYLKRKREAPTPKRLAAATTPAHTSSDAAEAFPEVNFNDHSAYKRLLSSVWDFKGEAPWSHYTVQQVPQTLPRSITFSHHRSSPTS